MTDADDGVQVTAGEVVTLDFERNVGLRVEKAGDKPRRLVGRFVRLGSAKAKILDGYRDGCGRTGRLGRFEGVVLDPSPVAGKLSSDYLYGGQPHFERLTWNGTRFCGPTDEVIAADELVAFDDGRMFFKPALPALSVPAPAVAPASESYVSDGATV